MSYQDVWIRGKLVKKGRRSCEGRFEAIRDYMQRTRKKHPLTVLDLGANAGYFSFRLAEELDAKVTMMESSPEILQYHKQNANRNVSLIHKRVDAHFCASWPSRNIMMPCLRSVSSTISAIIRKSLTHCFHWEIACLSSLLPSMRKSIVQARAI